MLPSALRSFLVLFAVMIVAQLSVTTAHADKRVALVLGISAYEHVAKLPNPSNDAVAMADLLKKAGFDVVETHRDVGIASLRRAVGDFSDKAQDADVAVVFYAGHGIEVDGTNYLVPADAKLARDFDIEDEALSLDRLLKAIEPAKRLRLVMLDACRDNPFSKTMKRAVASRSVGRGLAKIEPTVSDTLIAFAAKAGSVALDGDNANSPFTTALLENIAVPGIDLRIAFGRVRDSVLTSTGRKQEPYVYGRSAATPLPSSTPRHPLFKPRTSRRLQPRRSHHFRQIHPSPHVRPLRLGLRRPTLPRPGALCPRPAMLPCWRLSCAGSATASMAISPVPACRN